MRLTCLLLMEVFIHLHAYSQPPLMDRYLRSHPGDILGKYSYLIVTIDLHTNKQDVATGFFYRSKNKLFLVSAYHVFTGFDVLNRRFKDIRPDTMTVWYRDSADKFYRTEGFSLEKYHMRDTQDILRLSDVDIIEVSDRFREGKINSVDSLVLDDGANELLVGDIIVAYGFPNVSNATMDSLHHHIKVPARAFVCKTMTAPKRSPGSDVTTVYSYLSPPLQPGVSGAPIFRVRSRFHEKTLEFMGIQSYSNDTTKLSLIVKEGEMTKKLRDMLHLK